MPNHGSKYYSPSYLIGKYGIDAYQSGAWHSLIEASLKKEEEDMTTVLDAREGFKFGCDPELFVFHNDKPVSAEGLIPGTKTDPHPVYHKGELVGMTQVDGMAAEFNIPPVSTFRDFNRYIETTMKILEGMLPEGHELRAVPAVTFDEETFNAAPDKAKELGCSPDYNAWTGEVNPSPKDPDNPFLRTASGHLHIGWTEDADSFDQQHVLNCRDLVKQLDWYLGGWSLKIDADPVRRRLYGQAGAMRFKSYGVEYRVLSNFWVTSRERRLAVWNRMQKAINDIARSYIPDKAADWNSILMNSINTGKLEPTLAQTFRSPLLMLSN